MAFTPTLCALGIFRDSQSSSAVCLKTDIDPSELAQANIRPNSLGAHWTEFTDESCSLYSFIFSQHPLISFQIITRLS